MYLILRSVRDLCHQESVATQLFDKLFMDAAVATGAVDPTTGRAAVSTEARVATEMFENLFDAAAIATGAAAVAAPVAVQAAAEGALAEQETRSFLETFVSQTLDATVQTVARSQDGQTQNCEATEDSQEAAVREGLAGSTTRAVSSGVSSWLETAQGSTTAAPANGTPSAADAALERLREVVTGVCR